MPSGQQLKFKQASAKVRAEGIKPFTKAFGKRMKQILGGTRSKSVRKRSKSRGSKPKSRSQSRKGSKRSGSSTMAKKKGGGRKGTSLKTRAIKFGAGAGIAVVISIIANALRRQEVNAVTPILDAAAGLGVEGQIGTTIVRTVAPLIQRSGFSLNGGTRNGAGAQMMALEGA